MEEGLSYSLSGISMLILMLVVFLALQAIAPLLKGEECSKISKVVKKLMSLAKSLNIDASGYLRRLKGC
ncbi:MAG: hypothetical protein J7L91_05060 [Candidatus Korarchaeota archaeon]|nr:hypothetical protein [Candidatus Korarchaeota archaeon]